MKLALRLGTLLMRPKLGLSSRDICSKMPLQSSVVLELEYLWRAALIWGLLLGLIVM